MITAKELNTKGIASIEDSLANTPEEIITVEGKERFVVMKLEHYHHLREKELEAALYETDQDISNNRFSKESVDQHVNTLFSE